MKSLNKSICRQGQVGSSDQMPRMAPTHQDLEGQSNFSLENFISQHRNAYVSMQASAEHVQYQLPNKHSRGWIPA